MPMKPKKDYGGGLNLSPNKLEHHPSGPPRHGDFGQAERAFTLASTFLSGVLAITASQFLGAPLKFIDPAFYDAYMAYTKESFAVLITSLTQWWAPTVVRVSGDESMKGQLTRLPDGSLQCNFSERLVLMANHQLYTDWLYLWWIAYTNKMHGRIYIILKESLKKVPILGWGCQFYNFIFLSRKWEQDQARFKESLSHLKRATDPMWLLIFPEGTNLSSGTREKSAEWAKKSGLQDMKHQLLPRSTGLRFCLKELRGSTSWLYDCTIAYEGVPAGQYGQDVFTLRSSFFEGRPPKSVNMHWRRFPIADIPIDSPKAFDVWLRNRWREKDYLLEHFAKHSRFPASSYWKEHLASSDARSDKSSSASIRSTPRPAITIETEVKSARFDEFLRIFAPITALAMALFLAYGASPGDLPFADGGAFFQQVLSPLMGQVNMPNDIADIEKMLDHGVPGMPDVQDPPEIKMKGNTPADKAKQQKYLQLFKDSLPKDVSLEAEQRRRIGQFVKGLPDTRAARKAAIQGVQNGVQKNQTRTAISKKPTASASTGVPSPRFPLSTKTPTATSKATSQRAPSTTSRFQLPQASTPVPPPSKARPTSTSPQYATINGIRVLIQPSQSPVPPSIPASTLQTLNGVRIKSTDKSVPVKLNTAMKPAPMSVKTVGGVHVKMSNPSSDTPRNKPVQTRNGQRIKRSSGTNNPKSAKTSDIDRKGSKGGGVSTNGQRKTDK